MKNKLLAQCVMTLTFLLVSFIVVAQTKVLKGKVVDETQGPLAGATIKVKGGTAATTTDTEGSLHLLFPVKRKRWKYPLLIYFKRSTHCGKRYHRSAGT
jgi:iron complex outermembrane receptor protein